MKTTDADNNITDYQIQTEHKALKGQASLKVQASPKMTTQAVEYKNST
jgi:hypothetical protein